MRGVVRDAPKFLLADFLAGAVQLEKAARLEQVDALDRSTGTDNETVPYATGDGLRVKARRAQKPRG
jgi:hypothetical protein